MVIEALFRVVKLWLAYRETGIGFCNYESQTP
jgi:hypothetical protein